MNRRQFIASSLAVGSSPLTSVAKTHSAPLLSGLGFFDQITGGLAPGDVVQILAHPPMRSSDLALQIAWNISERDAVTYIAPDGDLLHRLPFDTRTDRVKRILLSSARVDHGRFDWGYLTRAERTRLQRAMDALSKKRLSIIGSAELPAGDLKAISAVAERATREEGMKLLVVDDLSEIEPLPRWPERKTRGEYESYGRFFRSLAERLGTAVLLCNALPYLRAEEREQVDAAAFGVPAEFCSALAIVHPPRESNPYRGDGVEKVTIQSVKHGATLTDAVLVGWRESHRYFI